MAKASGIGMTASIDDGSGAAQVITPDITNLTIDVSRAVQDVTDISDAGMERLLLLGDLSMGLNGVFNDAANLSHAVFKTVPSQAEAQTRAVSIAISGQTLTAEAYATNYVLTRAPDGSFTWSVPMVNGDGVVPAWS